MIAALAILILGIVPSTSEASSPRDHAGQFVAGAIITAIDANAEMPSKEYGLFRPASEDAGEEEDGDGDDAKSFGAGLPSISLTLVTPTLLASARQRARRAIASQPRVTFLRC